MTPAGKAVSDLIGCVFTDPSCEIVARAAIEHDAVASACVAAWFIERDSKWFRIIHSAWTIQQAVDPTLWRENWTADANKALRFSRREDAEAMIRYFNFQRALATEHTWIAALKAAETGGVG